MSWPILACSFSTSRSRSPRHPGRRRRRRPALRSPAAASSWRKSGWGGPLSDGPEANGRLFPHRLQGNLQSGVNLASRLRHGSLRLSNGAADLQLSPWSQKPGPFHSAGPLLPYTTSATKIAAEKSNAHLHGGPVFLAQAMVMRSMSSMPSANRACRHKRRCRRGQDSCINGMSLAAHGVRGIRGEDRGTSRQDRPDFVVIARAEALIAGWGSASLRRAQACVGHKPM